MFVLMHQVPYSIGMTIILMQLHPFILCCIYSCTHTPTNSNPHAHLMRIAVICHRSGKNQRYFRHFYYNMNSYYMSHILRLVMLDEWSGSQPNIPFSNDDDGHTVAGGCTSRKTTQQANHTQIVYKHTLSTYTNIVYTTHM